MVDACAGREAVDAGVRLGRAVMLLALAALLVSPAGAGEVRRSRAPRVSPAARETPRRLDNPLFVFNNGVKDETYDTPAKQVALLKKLGYAGMEKNGLDDFAEMQAELDRQGLKLFTVYVNVNLDPGEPAYDPRLPEVIRSLKGRETMLWLNLTSRGGTFASSAREGDATARRLVGEIADLAAASGLRVMLYPHVWFWLESVPHAIELVEALKRPNVGLTFNLPHWLALTPPAGEKSLRELLVRARPHLFAVSVNGASNLDDKSDRGTIWKSLIQPLGQGSFDSCGLLQTLVELDFHGPVGLQCYDIPGDKAGHLAQSMTAWKACQARIAGAR